MTVLENGYITDGMNEFERNAKRLMDLFTALICLIVFSPLFLICYIAVKREDGGPAIFKQERIGRFGRPFYIYKFRSMRIDAEKDGPALYQHERDTRIRRNGIHRTATGTAVLHRPDYGARPALCLSVPDPPGSDELCHALQWLYRHHREDAAPVGTRPVLLGESLVVVRYQDSGQDLH